MKYLVAIFSAILFLTSCNSSPKKNTENASKKIKILIDADANNELDDQHALAYAFLNDDVFDIVGVTVNNTIHGDGIQGHYDEALRIIRLLNLEDEMPLKKGATGTYKEIAPNISNPDFDGAEAVDFIIEEALKMQNEKLVLLPVGKLTNVTLAILKEPKIIDKIRVVWLGSNYPAEGEYNLENDTTSINPVIESGVEFEMVMVRYDDNTGTTAVRVTKDEIEQNVKGRGPKANHAIIGRHGGEFTTFGDYSYNLFEHAEMYGNPPARSLFDMATVAIVKNPDWADRVEIPAPKLIGKGWIDQPENENKIIIWENFDRDAIVNDFYKSLSKI